MSEAKTKSVEEVSVQLQETNELLAKQVAAMEAISNQLSAIANAIWQTKP